MKQHRVPKGPLWGPIQQGDSVQLGNGALIEANKCQEITDCKRKIIIAGDNDKPSLLHTPAIDAELLVHEATYTEEK